ncbi:MAG: hypothetical protein E7641_08615 [Ruminococcaceae bacterium]|nr:hypothetical protein [Oscillospiraceae bacterium]
MNFDATLNVRGSLDYGIIYGNEGIVFIKSGRGGTCRGYEDKYLKMAKRLNSSRGYTVICASNPPDPKISCDIDKSVIEKVISEKGFDNFELFLVGSSNGAYQNLFLANQLTDVKKIMGINMPLMIDPHKINRTLSTLDSVEKIFVYGTEDPSFSYIPMLEIKNLPRFRVIRVKDADHNFKSKTDTFVELVDLI